MPLNLIKDEFKLLGLNVFPSLKTISPILNPRDLHNKRLEKLRSSMK
jgi:hypothetical protein